MKKFLFYISLFILSWIYSTRFQDVDFDLYSRLYVGKIFFGLGEILKFDPFAFTHTKSLWIDHEWGSSLVFWLVNSHFGDSGLIFLKIVVLFLCMLFIHKTIKLYEKQNPFNIIYYFFLILAVLNGFAGNVRCQIFTFLFFSIWLYMLEKARIEQKNRLWFFPLSMLIWANMHGGFVVGLGLLFLYGIGEYFNKKPCKQYFIVLFLSVLTTLINPFGFEYWKYIIQATTMPRPNVSEWHLTSLFGSLKEWFAFKAVILMTIISTSFYLFKNKLKNIDITKFLLLAVMLFMAIKHIKHQPFFVITAGSFIYSDFYSIFDFLKQKLKINFQNALSNFEIRKEIFVCFLIIVLGSIIIIFSPLNLFIPQKKFPVASVEFIKQHKLKGNVLSLFNWGSYLSYQLYPDCLVAIDGRYEEVYPEETVNLTSNFIYVLDKNWYEITKKHKIDILLLDKKFESYTLIKKSPDWKKVFEDQISAVFVRKNYPVKKFALTEINYGLINKNKFKTSKDFLDKIKKK